MASVITDTGMSLKSQMHGNQRVNFAFELRYNFPI